MLLSSPPRLLSRLACLNRIPIAVAAGRINRSQILLTVNMSSRCNETLKLAVYHVSPMSRDGTLFLQMSVFHETFVASNVRTKSSRLSGWSPAGILALHISLHLEGCSAKLTIAGLYIKFINLVAPLKLCCHIRSTFNLTEFETLNIQDMKQISLGCYQAQTYLRVGDLVDHRQVSSRRTVAVFALNAMPYSRVFPFRPLQ